MDLNWLQPEFCVAFHAVEKNTISQGCGVIKTVALELAVGHGNFAPIRKPLAPRAPLSASSARAHVPSPRGRRSFSRSALPSGRHRKWPGAHARCLHGNRGSFLRRRGEIPGSQRSCSRHLALASIAPERGRRLQSPSGPRSRLLAAVRLSGSPVPPPLVTRRHGAAEARSPSRRSAPSASRPVEKLPWWSLGVTSELEGASAIPSGLTPSFLLWGN